MRGAKTKAIRRAVKLHGTNARESEYEVKPKTGSFILKPDCGRAVYKKLKEFMR